jgi:hypothetical protein
MYDWSDASSYLEIVPGNRLREPIFRGTGDPDTTYYRSQSGADGVLSSNDFIKGHFSPPVVTRVANGFVVKRWIFAIPGVGNPTVELWIEHVGYDGNYGLSVISRSSPPSLPGTSWYITGRA